MKLTLDPKEKSKYNTDSKEATSSKTMKPKNNFFRVKNISGATVEGTAGQKSQSLVRTLSAVDLICLGIGSIIGTGIFVLTGIAASNYAGPAVFFSFILAAFACALAAFVYSEFSSLIPLAGSAYTYVYLTLGEIPAWLIGWTLLLEYLVASSVVAIGWSNYFNNFLNNFGIHIPIFLSAAPGVQDVPGAVMNLPAASIIILLTILGIIGIRSTTFFNKVVVFINVSCILFFILFGLSHINPENWHPFLPERVATVSTHTANILHLPFNEFLTKLFQGTLSIHNDLIYHYGWQGVVTAAGIVFFAYIGFDAVSTVAEETKNPQKDLPIGIIGSLIICTILYLAVSLVLTGLIPVTVDGKPNPALVGHDAGAALSIALTSLGYKWAALIVAFGALCGMTSIILVMIVGQARILFAISRDGLLPKFFSNIHPKFRTPYIATLITGIFAACIAAFTPILAVAELTSIGTLAAFTFVSLAVLILRATRPDLKARFQCPFMPYTGILGIAANLLLMFGLPTATWVRFIGWMFIGFLIYFMYGYWFSGMRDRKE